MYKKRIKLCVHEYSFIGLCDGKTIRTSVVGIASQTDQQVNDDLIRQLKEQELLISQLRNGDLI